MQQSPDPDMSSLGVIISTIKQTKIIATLLKSNVLSNGQYI